jgi:hypothetical protein
MPQGLDEGESFYRGRSWMLRVNNAKKSAEAIVAIGNEPRIETVEDSPDNEGLNVKQLQIPNGVSNSRR